jgi:hypothetical protein
MKNAPVESHIPLLELAIKSYRTTATTISNDFLYRSRVNNKGHLFEHVDQLKYPDSTLVKYKGRLNNIGQSILYASTSIAGTIIESRPSLNYVVTISKINRKNDSLVYFLPLGFRNHEYGNPPSNKCHSLVSDYLNEELVKQVTSEDDYNSTIAIYNIFVGKRPLKYGQTKLDVRNISIAPNLGLLYPSVQSKLISNMTTHNIAMKPPIYENYYKIFETGVYCLILDTDDDIVQIHLNNGVISDNGRINWKFTFSEMVKRASEGVDYYGHHEECLKEIKF